MSGRREIDSLKFIGRDLCGDIGGRRDEGGGGDDYAVADLPSRSP